VREAQKHDEKKKQQAGYKKMRKEEPRVAKPMRENFLCGAALCFI
jgi:hypothetical protein